LTTAWSIACCGILTATAWAVGRPQPSASDAIVQPVASALPFTPGYGWYAAQIVGTLVDDVEFKPSGSGPAIVEVPSKMRHIARVATVGRDARGGLVPILYVHAPGESVAQFIIAQRGSDALLRGVSRAGRIGLAPLDLVIPGAFAAGSMQPADTTLVTARVSGRALELSVARGAARWSGTLLRTPTVGWALVQSLVEVSSRPATALTALWLSLLTLPVGYWGWWTRRRRATVIIGAAVVLSACMVIAVRAFGVGDPPAWQWYLMAAGLALGMLVAQFVMTRADNLGVPADA
ncbi:MAG TPA: hypothetical protein VE869_15745, partial [Gemmatimonas sp.]|nr:hypothetical protein [Gemmatimonas sp.]